MSDRTETDACEGCEATTDREEAVRPETMGGLDPDCW